MYCGAAYHDWAFAGVDGCEVVRLYDVESDMCRLAKLFFDRRRCRGDVVRQLDIRAENVGELVTDVETAVAHADQAWVHVCKHLQLTSAIIPTTLQVETA